MKFKANYIFDFFLPRICPGCNIKISDHNEPVCADCLNSIQIAESDRINFEFKKNFNSSKVIKDFHSKYIFETDKTLQHIIHALKYNRQFKLGLFLGKILGEDIQAKNWAIDLILPAPIHHLRKAERGYNQTDYVAKGLSISLNVPYSARTVKRIKYTESQTKLNMNERAQNVSNAFKVTTSKKIKGKNILIVDDICTTGATILECGIVLYKSGANSIYASSIAIAA
jgi:ComF family protein